MKTIFISRKLLSTSVFRTTLEAKGFTIHGKSLLNFSAIEFNKIPSSNWIFFYSKNGVKFFFNQLKKKNISVPTTVQWATIGKKTGKALQQKVDKVNFTGGGNTLETAMDFLKVAKNRTVLFPQAFHSRKTIQRLLENNIIAKELIVYKNEPKKNVRIPNCEYLVFTSPMNVKAYFKDRSLFDNQKIFAIGRTTEKTLVSIGIEDYNVAEEPSEEALVKAILKTI